MIQQWDDPKATANYQPFAWTKAHGLSATRQGTPYQRAVNPGISGSSATLALGRDYGERLELDQIGGVKFEGRVYVADRDYHHIGLWRRTDVSGGADRERSYWCSDSTGFDGPQEEQLGRHL